jgi:flavin-binding protein dodecin
MRLRYGCSGTPRWSVAHCIIVQVTPERFEVKQSQEDRAMAVYKVIELVGTSTESWEMAARTAVERASQSLRDLRVAEVVELDMQITDGKIEAYRAKVKLSFKFEDQQ